MVATMGPKVAILCESIKVAHEANELWRANLQLRERRLAMVEKQVARDECLIGTVQALTAAMSCTDLVVDLAQGRGVGGVGKGRSMGKGKRMFYREEGRKEKEERKRKLGGGLTVMQQVMGNSLSAILGGRLIGVSLVE